jgi:cobalt-zinc-cadmium efflux system outer membrane protein
LRELTEAARARLPSLQALAARVREAEAEVEVAEREAWVKPSIGVQYQRESNRALEGIYHVVLGSVALPLPLFQRNQGPRAEARAALLQAQAEHSAALQRLSGHVALAHSALHAAAQRVRAYHGEIVPHFEENLRLLARSFELGEIDLLALSAARERFLQIQADALGAQRDYVVALSALERTLGSTLPPSASEEPVR